MHRHLYGPTPTSSSSSSSLVKSSASSLVQKDDYTSPEKEKISSFREKEDVSNLPVTEDAASSDEMEEVITVIENVSIIPDEDDSSTLHDEEDPSTLHDEDSSNEKEETDAPSTDDASTSQKNNSVTTHHVKKETPTVPNKEVISTSSTVEGNKDIEKETVPANDYSSGIEENTGSEMSDDLSNSGCEADVKNEEIKDPFCDPENPKVLTFNDVSAAAYKIKNGIEKTPCTYSQMSRQYNMQLYFKKEILQYTGSFKERGARYTLLQLEKAQREAGVIAASAGNHALALSYHGLLLEIPVTVVMPIIAPMMKVEACKQYGATVIIHGQHIGEARDFAMKIGRDKKLLYVNGYDHPHILAGAGTMGLEILEQVPHLDACIFPVGGGGLIAGCSVALKTLKPDVQIIGVESERTTSFAAALKAGHPVFEPVSQTLSDGLAVPVFGVNAFATAAPLVDKVVKVKESSIALAILRLIEQEKAVVEGAGATGLAALVEGLLPELEGKSVVVALCGGNIDTTALGRVIDRGLAAEGRLVRFEVTVSDRPGGIAELTRRIADLGVSIKDILHERAWLQTDVFSVRVRVVVETRDLTHARELEKEMNAHYRQVSFWLDHKP